MTRSPTQADCIADILMNDGVEGDGRGGGKGGEQRCSHLHVYSSSVGRGRCLFARVRRTCPIINPVVSSTTLSDCSTCKHGRTRRTHISASQLCLPGERAGERTAGLHVSIRVICRMAGMESAVF